MMELTLHLCAVVHYKTAIRTWVSICQTLETNISDARCIMTHINDGLVLMIMFLWWHTLIRLTPILKNDCMLHSQICISFSSGGRRKKIKWYKHSHKNLWVLRRIDSLVKKINTHISQYNGAGRVPAWKIIDTSSQLWWPNQTHSLDLAVTFQAITLLDHRPDMCFYRVK